MHVRQGAAGNASRLQYYKQRNENFMYYDPQACRFVLHFNSNLKTGTPVIGYIRRDEQRELFDFMDGWVHYGRPHLLGRFKSLVCNHM
jgi:hypothetical protein